MQEYGKDFDLPVAGSRAVIQGFGNVGANLARLIHEAGGKVLAVADIDGAIYNEDGLDMKRLFEHSYKQRKPVSEFEDADRIDSNQIWKISCDWMIPAALGGVITKEANVDNLDCRVVVEAANSPTTPIADKVLDERGIVVLPDFLVNAGGVVVSYFEWTQNLQQHPWSLEQVNGKLREKMQIAYGAVRDIVQRERVPWRTAAYAIGLQRVAEAERLRGQY